MSNKPIRCEPNGLDLTSGCFVLFSLFPENRNNQSLALLNIAGTDVVI